MKRKDKIIKFGLILTVIGLLIYVLVKTKFLENRVKELEEEKLRLQKFLFQKYGDSPSVIVEEIDRLINQYETFHPETTKNLSRAKELYLEGHGEEAIKKLVVIIENKIKQKFEQENDFWYKSLPLNKKRFVKFDALFNRAKETELFNDLQYSIAKTAVSIRNRESHQEGFSDNPNRVQICILGSIEIINLLVPKELESTKLQIECV